MWTVPDLDSLEFVKRDGWTFLTNHGHVLVCLAQSPDVLLRDVAARIGITERSVQQIVADLERAGVIIRMRVGRRNRYLVRREESLRHPLEAGVSVGQLVDLVGDGLKQLQRHPHPHSRGPAPGTVSLSSFRTAHGDDAALGWDDADPQPGERPSSR